MSKSQFSDHTPEEWIKMWGCCVCSTLETMYKNLNADLEAGYKPWGFSVRQSLAQINEYEAEWQKKCIILEMHDQVMMRGFRCYRWLKESGNIE